MTPGRHAAIALGVACGLCLPGTARGTDDLTVRARVVSVTPGEPVHLGWRAGGEGLGGEVSHGDLAPEWIRPGEWSEEIPLSTLASRGRPPFVTFTAKGRAAGKAAPPDLRKVTFEIQFRQGGRVLDDVVENGPEGATATVRIAFDRAERPSDRAFAFGKETMGLSEYAKARLRLLRALPWAKAPVPRRLAVITDLYGWGQGVGYAVRTTDRAVIETELQSLRELGVNGIRSAPPFVNEEIRGRTGLGPDFSRIKIVRGLGYPVPRWDAHKLPAAGCPYHPSLFAFRNALRADTRDLVLKETQGAVEDEEWFLEVDEIGSVFDLSPEGKAHQSVCPYCTEAFRDSIRGRGLAPSDFGATSWDAIRSTYAYWDTPLPLAPSGKVDGFELEKGEAKPSAAAAPALAVPGAPAGPPPIEQGGQRAQMTERGWALLYDYSRRFNADSSAMLLAPEREAFEELNEEKRRAIAAGRLDSPEARRPWVYTYALRGVTFLTSGHSLDLFDFYRQADTGFVFETSNRDARVWGWDSYVADVGRMLSDRMGLRSGIYVKPHRGAVIQRALSAVSREAKMLFWYTYGPDWVKGDSFAQSNATLASVSRAARLLAASEDVLYDGKWAVPAEIAVVRPRTSEFFESAASWENGKWIYAALTHAHLPVDPLDEGMLEVEDLSRYKVIYVSGSHLRRASAGKLDEWVRRGGVLFTSGWGLARDEANEPLAELEDALGLHSRAAVELWADVPRYESTALPPLRGVHERPSWAAVSGQAPFGGAFQLSVGREVLAPSPDARVLARFADGAPALTRHEHGRGAVYVAGFYAGVEYGSDVMRPVFDMSRDFSPTKRAFISAPALAAGIRPVVDCPAAPLVEGILVKNASTGKSAVSLMNWAYRALPGTDGAGPAHAELVPMVRLEVRVRGAPDVRRVLSASTGSTLPFSREGDVLVVTLPRLEEADVLLLQ